MKNKIVAAAVAMVLILICFVPVMLSFADRDREDYEIVCFGDSVMACFYGDGSIPYYIEELTGRTTLNAAFGGLPMSELREVTFAGDSSYLFSMVELSKALLNKDFSLQIIGTKQRVQEYTQEWYGVADSLDKLDYNSVQYVIIEHGVNDYLMGKALDDSADRYNESTFAGALRTSIENVRKALPNATVVLVTPAYMKLESMDGDCMETDFGGGTLPDYVAKEKEVAAEYGLTCVDNFSGSGINKDNYKEYLYDGLHSHQGGNVLMAENIVRNVEGMCTDENTR